MRPDDSDLDITIIGGGVAGLYTAWRLIEAGHDPGSIQIFEGSGRTGGRLWSVFPGRESSIPAELGGMFFNDQQDLVYTLCTRTFGLDHEPVAPRPDFAWLRASRFKVEQFSDPDILPYHLAADEKHLSYYQLLALATRRIAPELDKLWPKNPDSSPQATIAYLRRHTFDGTPLHRWGFWNLLARVISNEAWNALRGIVSSYTLFENWNGYDAMISLVVEQAGKWFRLTHGYEQLPDTLAHKVREAGGAIHMNHRLVRIERESDGLRLALTGPDGNVDSHTRRLVLALPQYALGRLIDHSPELQGTALAQNLDSVSGVPACKIFLTFDRPWWRDVPDGPGRISTTRYGVSHTDLPVRQCYYLGMDEATGRGLMLASYADGDAVAFWRALMEDCGRDRRLKQPLSDRARDEIRRQLSEMHGVAVPAPVDGLFIDWTVAPFGGGWHNWQPGWKSWRMIDRMRRPMPDWPLYLCGESYSAAQGWTEGALGSAESLLQHEFGLAAPAWLKQTEVTLAAYVSHA
ncbi:MAG: flavin monoamine oxidase family protein [Wenzhouxiangellaceae bacterium]